MMKAVRVTDEWQRAGVHYVRTQAMCLGFKIPLEGEFSDDTPEDEYILVMDGIYPVSTCRLHYLDEHTGKIERVATLESYRGRHYGQAGIIEAENWMREKGVTKIYINSRKAALGFYEKLGYTETDIPAFLGIDGTDEGLEAVLEEKMAATVYNDKEAQANAMAQLARQLVTGEKMKKVEFENQRYIYLPYEKVTKDNVQDFLK